MVGEYNRDISRRKALHKRRIDRLTQGHYSRCDYYDNLHQYSKNKVHCSCSMCSTKTRNKGRKRFHYGNYNRSINYGRSDLRKQINMDDQIQELTGRKIHRATKNW
jgi:hypothetical protein